MKCEYCGSRIQEVPHDDICPKCGGRVYEKPSQAIDNVDGLSQINLEYYYEKYKPDRVQAIMALRVDTGMGAVQSKKAIDLIFDFHESRATSPEEERIKGIEQDVCCPNCQSKNVVLHEGSKRHVRYLGFYSNAKMRAISSVFNLVHTIADKVKENGVTAMCKNCGNTWSISK